LAFVSLIYLSGCPAKLLAASTRPGLGEQKQPTVDREEMEAILRESQEADLTLYSLLAACGPMRPGEPLGLDIRAIHPDFQTLDIVQKAKRGELPDYMKTKNADSETRPLNWQSGKPGYFSFSSS
jgi:integrase